MFFEKDNISFKILEVILLDQKNINLNIKRRTFDALAYRYCSKALFTTEEQSVSLSDGSMVFMPSSVSYVRHAEYDRLIAVHISTENYFSSEIEYFSARDTAFFAEKFQNIYDCWNSKCTGYRYKCNSIFNEILSKCYEENYRESKSFGIIDESVKYLNEHFTEPTLTIEKIASKSFISDVYFRKLFKSYFGMSPSKYIIKLRIQHAIGLMATGYYSLKEIAYLSGYTDYPYFSAEFKRLKGVSPSEYLYNCR